MPRWPPSRATAADALLSVDLRAVDPRRPLPAGADGSAAGGAVTAADGLVPYSPFFPLRHGMQLNHGAPLSRVGTLLAAPTGWESTGLVVALGADARTRLRRRGRRSHPLPPFFPFPSFPVGIDHFFARVMTAKTYDQLDANFNPSLFMAFMVACVAGLGVLQELARRKSVADAWK